MKLLYFTAILLLFLQAQAASFSYSNPSFISNDFVAYGSGIINSTGLTVSQEGDLAGAIIFYNQPLLLANGFSTQFTIDITNCDTNYNGADGFAFVLYPQLPGAFSPPVGSAIGITDSSNLAAVGFILVSDILTVCAVDMADNLGGVSLKDDLTHCVQNETSADNAMRNLRCSGPHTIGITFTSPAGWEITIDGTASYTFTKDLLSNLDWDVSYTGYVGFSGGVAAGFMDQIITSWSLTTTSGCLATCDPAAQCNVFSNNNTVACSCPNGYFGDGTSPCIPVRTNNVIPILECYEAYGDSIYEAFYGYRSLENVTVAIPFGAENNYIGFDAFDLPQVFEPGRTPFYPANAFSVEFEGYDPVTLTWHLGNYEVTFSSNDSSRLCSSNLTIVLQFITSRQLDANETSLILNQLCNLLGISFGRISVVKITYTAYNTKRRSADQVAELELEISGTNETTSNEPRASQAVQQFISASSNTTLMNEVVNPDPDNPDPSRTFLDVKTTSSGTETLGQVLPQPIAPIAPLAPQAPSEVPTMDPDVPSSTSRPSAVPRMLTSKAQSHEILGNIVLFAASLGVLLLLH